MRVVVVERSSKLLDRVVELGDRHRAVLGLFPRSAFEASADEGHILAAITDDGVLAGYLLYRAPLSRRLVRLVHLCISEAYRRRGVARLLVDTLADRTRPTHDGIRLLCRRDYADARLAWPRLYFTVKGEQPGRGREHTPLTVWVRSYGGPDLFTSSADDTADRIRVAVDTNVFLDLVNEDVQAGPESVALLGDWLGDAIELCVTDELGTEIDRQGDQDTRTRLHRLMQRYGHVSATDDQHALALQCIRAAMPSPETASDESDLRHLAWCAAAGITVFVTRDAALLRHAGSLPESLGLSVVRPADLIVQQDELRRGREYRPARLAGTEIRRQKLDQSRIERVTDDLRAGTNERKRAFRSLLNKSLADPLGVDIMVVEAGANMLAMYALDRRQPGQLIVPLLRVAANTNGRTVARHLLRELTRLAASEGRPAVRVTDPFAGAPAGVALADCGYLRVEEEWQRIALGGYHRLADALTELRRLASEPCLSAVAAKCAGAVEAARMASSAEGYVHAERCLGAKLQESELPVYVVPIHPRWARALFDVGLAGEMLYGVPDQLMLSTENVYYRDGRQALTAPARILWYVTKHDQGHSGTGAVRGVSYLDSFVRGPACELYARFRRLGVYGWKDVLGSASENPYGRIGALLFAETELYPSPVQLDDLRSMWRAETGKSLSLRCPVRVPANFFVQVHMSGLGGQPPMCV